MPRGWWATLLAAAVSASCVTAGAPPRASLTAEQEEPLLLTRAEVYEDAHLVDYLATIVDRLASETEREVGATPVRLTVVRDPTINAFAMPNGRVYVHTGLLARVANEAQLATILARELTHLSRRHALARPITDGPVGEALARLAPSIAAVLSADTGERVLSPMAEAILGKRLAIAYTASMAGYGRDLERDADMGAIERLVRAAYDPKEAPRVFERLRREARSGGIVERFVLGSDAALAERIESTTRVVAGAFAVAAAVPDTVRDTDAFEPAILPLVRENARLEMAAGRFRAAQEQLDRILGVTPADPLAHLYYGDLHRLRAQRTRSVADRDELARKARASYERCASLDPGIVEVPRQLGLLYYQQGQSERAREAFTRYIALAPDAPDAPRVKEYVAALTRE